jgi:hypothetical protein
MARIGEHSITSRQAFGSRSFASRRAREGACYRGRGARLSTSIPRRVSSRARRSSDSCRCASHAASIAAGGAFELFDRGFRQHAISFRGLKHAISSMVIVAPTTFSSVAAPTSPLRGAVHAVPAHAQIDSTCRLRAGPGEAGAGALPLRSARRRNAGPGVRSPGRSESPARGAAGRSEWPRSARGRQGRVSRPTLGSATGVHSACARLRARHVLAQRREST